MNDETPDMDVVDLDLSAENITAALREAELYRKKVIVQARPAAAGERVTTVLADGTEETTNTAEEGDIIITNPGGERYVMNFQKFTARYDAIDEQGNFRAKGIVRAVANPTGQSIRVMAPWGEPQLGDAACIIASPYDAQQPDTIGTDRYIIGKDEFLTTYEPYIVEDAAMDAAPLTPEQVSDELAEEVVTGNSDPTEEA